MHVKSRRASISSIHLLQKSFFREVCVKYFVFLLGISVMFLSPTLEVRADFICKSDISYKWTQSPPAQQKTPAADPADKPDILETVVYFSTVERSGATDVLAKTALEGDLARAKGKALEDCQRNHENLASCVATKLNINASLLNSISFNARKELEKAITTECQGWQGKCQPPTASEAACVEQVVAGATPTAGAEEGKKAATKKK